VTARQRVVLGALRGAQHEQHAQAASAPVRSLLAAPPAPWQDRPDLVTQALWLLQAQGPDLLQLLLPRLVGAGQLRRELLDLDPRASAPLRWIVRFGLILAGPLSQARHDDPRLARLTVYARLDDRDYPKGIEISDAALDAVHLHPDDFHGDWNYTITPSQTES
jgi:hypothetical protein